MGNYPKANKYYTKLADNECRIPSIEESQFMNKDSFLNLCRAKNERKPSFGRGKGQIDFECRNCPIGKEINSGKDVLPINIRFLGVVER